MKMIAIKMSKMTATELLVAIVAESTQRKWCNIHSHTAQGHNGNDHNDTIIIVIIFILLLILVKITLVIGNHYISNDIDDKNHDRYQ